MSDEVLHLQCTTCQSKLKVQDRKLIGQILPCPKCGSMVLVEPPAEPGAASPATPVDQTAKTPAGSGKPATIAGPRRSATPPPPAEPGAADTVPEELAEPESPDTSAAAEGKAPPTNTAAVPARPDDPVADAFPPPVPAEEPDADAEGASLLQQTLLVGGAACVGVALAVGVFLFFTRGASDSVVTQENDPANSLAAAGGTTAEPAATPAVTGGGDPPQKSSAEPLEDVPGGDKAAAASDPDRAGSPAPEPAPAPAAAPTAPAAESLPAPAAPAAEALAASEKPAEAETPPGLAPPPAAPSQGIATRFPQGFEKFERLLGGSPLTESDPGAVMREPRPDRPPLKPIDIPARLADPIAGIEFADVPLLHVLRFLSQFSTIPISFDFASLQRSDVSLQTPVKLRLENTTVAAVLEGVLAPLGLETVEAPGQIYIRVATPSSELVEQRYDVQGLVAEGAPPVTELVTRCVAPRAWEAAAGGGKVRLDGTNLIVEQTVEVQAELADFLDRLRAVRGLGEGAAAEPVAPRFARAADGLETPLSLTYLQPTPLVRILERLEKSVPLQFAVDWRALAEVQWGMDVSATLTATALPLREALDALLRPLELTYRVIDGKTLEITTPHALARQPEIEFFRLSPEAAREGPVWERDLLAQWALSAPPGVEYALVYDPPSRTLIARLPQPQQVRLAEFLKGK